MAHLRHERGRRGRVRRRRRRTPRAHPQGTLGRRGPLSFSALRDRVDVRDSGRFNYHLGELRGRFVEKGEDGYTLRYAGTRVVGGLYSGAYTEETSLGPVPVEGHCSHCGGDLEARYEDDHGYVDCTDCEVSVLAGAVPRRSSRTARTTSRARSTASSGPNCGR